MLENKHWWKDFFFCVDEKEELWTILMNEILRRFYTIVKQKFLYYKVIFNKKKRFLEIEIFTFVMDRIKKLHADLNNKKNFN